MCNTTTGIEPQGGQLQKKIEYEHPKCTYNFNIAVERKGSGVLESGEQRARRQQKLERLRTVHAFTEAPLCSRTRSHLV